MSFSIAEGMNTTQLIEEVSMSLILDRLTKCSVDPVSIIQKQLFQLPADSVNFVLDRTKALQLYIVNDRTATTRRLYAVNSELINDFGDIIKQYCFIPFRSELGSTGIMQVNLESGDSYSMSKRKAIEAEHDVFCVTRCSDTYKFSVVSDVQIEPVSDDEYDRMLNIVFSDSIIDSSNHKALSKLSKKIDEVTETIECPAVINEAEKVKTPEYDSVLTLDIDLDKINELL